MWIKDPKTNEKSVTLTILTVSVTVALLKLILSKISFGGFALDAFSASDFATILAASGGLYWGRKHTDSSNKEK